LTTPGYDNDTGSIGTSLLRRPEPRDAGEQGHDRGIAPALSTGGGGVFITTTSQVIAWFVFPGESSKVAGKRSADTQS